MPIVVQSILFDKSKWSKNFARYWISEHRKMGYGYKDRKIDETKKFYRFRQVKPIKGAKYWTEKFEDGVDIVIMKYGSD